MTQTFVSHSPDDLADIARWFVDTFPQPVTVLMEGGMGAGKTTLIGALCAYMGAEEMSSPTFALVNEYKGHNGRAMYHFDLYRLEHTNQALDIGFEDYLEQDAYLFVEWPAVIRPLIDQAVEVKIEDDGLQRIIQFSYTALD